jgi:ABC-type phosphate transport system ATPase subunit
MPAMPGTRSRPLPQPISIMDNGNEFVRLKTLADVRDFLKHVPKARRQFSTWQHVEAELNKAAAGADATQLSIALRMVLMLEHVEYRLR